jgi:6-pyruvoyltetrahydropterin/6-carboxytetrahydropterin synthase
MYTVCVRGHVMVAHSFRGELFGPAQRLHGATYVVDVEFRARDLTPEGVVVDIGRATTALGEVLGGLAFRNLDEMPQWSGSNTTTEVLAKFLFDELSARASRGALGKGSCRIASMKVTLHESHVAWASYEAALTGSP